MGTSQAQGRLWGARAADWAEANEPAWEPLFRAALNRLGVTPGARLLDVGCGAGGALAIARECGAHICGLDAAENLVAIARQRLPGAIIELGEMEELPFENDTFDVVYGINSFQFAEIVVRALGEAGRVCRPGGTVGMLVWGERKDCDVVSAVMPAVFSLLPPASAGSAPPVRFADPAVVEAFMRQAGLVPTARCELAAALVFPDTATTVRAIMSAAARAIQHAGADAVSQAIAGQLGPFTRRDGSVCLNNRFLLTLATA
jgi:SAM-dependent methyltransferase